MQLNVKVTSSACMTVFPYRRETSKTVCVLGVPRGGTSMIAGIVRKLGVFMGDDIDGSTNEDMRLLAHRGRRELFTNPALITERQEFMSTATKTVLERNDKFPVWGWKDPLSPYYLPDLMSGLRNPVFIMVARDLAAIAQREKIEENVAKPQRLLAYMANAIDGYSRCIDLVNGRSRPTILISYERALRSPREVGFAIQEFLAVEPPADFAAWLDSYVAADRMDGSIATTTATSGSSGRLQQFGSTDASRIMVDESLRPRREGAISGTSLSGNALITRANEHYERAAKALMTGDFEGGQSAALAVVGLYVGQFPELVDGPFGVISHQYLAGGGRVIYPDVVCGAYVLVGMSHMLRASAQKALLYFAIAEGMIRTRLLHHAPESILAQANYLSCLFHMGLAAKVMNRADIWEPVRDAFAGKAPPPVPGMNGMDEWAAWQARAAAEL